MADRKIFITTTLPYANSVPHIGHMFEFVLADAINRHQKISGESTIFNTGLDCHGTKIEQKAKELGMEPREYVQTLEPIWKEFCDKFHIGYDNFYMTSDPIHHRKVQEVWDHLMVQGDIYKKEYKGLYCTGCESFKVSKELQDGKCQDHPNLKLEEIAEENYFFKLSNYKDPLTIWLDTEGTDFLEPKEKIAELKNLISSAEDLSISRSSDKCGWGVPVPGDPSQTIYVWFDALLNYIFAAGYCEEKFHWQNVIQICGPDNLRFQAVIFQTILDAIHLKRSDKLIVHGTIVDSEGRKMSKTLGNVIDPIEQLEKYGLDAVRYYSLAGLSTTDNSSWNENELKNKFNSDICNSWGNLVSRTLHLIDTKLNGEINDGVSEDFYSDIDSTFEQIDDLWLAFDIKTALTKTAEAVTEVNKYITSKQPWSDPDPISVKKTLSNVYYFIKVVSMFYNPVFPHLEQKIADAIEEKKKIVLFKRID